MPAFEKAKWIWNGEMHSPNVYVSFEDSFSLPEKSGEVRLRISCDRNYALYCNGKFVDCGQYGDYEDLKYYDELDVTPYLSAGENKLLVTVFYQGQDCSNYRRGEAGVIYEVSGERGVLCASSEQTVTYKNSAYEDGCGVEFVSGQLGFTFHYDSLRESERLFESRAELVFKTADIAPRPIKKLTISERVPAMLKNRGAFADTVSSGTPAYKMQYSALDFSDPNTDMPLPSDAGIIIERSPSARASSGSFTPDGTFAVIDLGEENTGLLSLDIEVECDCDVFIGWGEHLDDMRVRSYVGGRNFAASYHAHAGRNVFFCPFLRCGLRYLQLAVYAPSFVLHYAG
ncbi:MAG: sugar-binding domain-containing protein, partial [Eubacteriales bacterium]